MVFRSSALGVPAARSADIIPFLRRHLQDPRSGWSIGTYGALAELHWEAGEPACLDLQALSLVTPRGAIRILPHPHAVAVAAESDGCEGGTRTTTIAFCLARDHARCPLRSRLTELGPDTGALREHERDAALFDLGLGAPHIEACVRTADPELLERLRAGLGQPLLEPGNPAADAIRAHSPHRVFRSRLGRIEVYQPIPAEDSRSPEGPHTHLLPRLLAKRRTHDPALPVPDGFLPALYLHPPGAGGA